MHFRHVAPLLLVACYGPAQTSLPDPLSIPPAGEVVRIVLIGDTGDMAGDPPGDAGRCDLDAPEYDITPHCRVHMQDSIAAEEADAIVALGDLVYTAGPVCPDEGLTDRARATLDRVLGSYLGDLGPPVLVVLGNHDVHQLPGHPGALRCYRAYAEEEPNLELPERNYLAYLGPLLIAVIDSNRPPEGALLGEIRAAIDAHHAASPDNWALIAAHHPIRTYRDNATAPEAMRDWFTASRLKPDAWVSGHAHFQQLVVVEGTPQVTSGAGSRALKVADCAPDGSGPCGEGERWSNSDTWGYAVATASADRLEITFKNFQGETLHTWSRDHDDPEGR